jgi:DNA-binding NarL/FixJ family response regulator
MLLEADGFSVVGEAVDGHNAIVDTARLAPDVVLLDVQLPDTDGFHVAAQLATLEPAPLIVLTSSRAAVDFGPLLGRSAAGGFIAKAELSGEALSMLLARG